MRDLDLDQYLDLASRELEIDIDTLVMSELDTTAAVLALRSAAGPPASENPAAAAADAVVRLLMALIAFQPVRWAYGNDRVTVAACRALAANVGHSITVADVDMLRLVDLLRAEELSRDDALRALGKALMSDRVGSGDGRLGLEGIRLSVSAAVSTPSPELAGATTCIRHGLQLGAEQRNIRIQQPVECHRITASGRTTRPRQWGRLRVRAGESGPAPEPRSTAAIMTGSMARTCGADAVVVIQDPGSFGIHVEREWALRLQLPIFEFVFSPDDPHPHQDAPGRIHTIEVDAGNPDRAVASFFAILESRVWEVRDAAAFRRSVELKNRTSLDHLCAGWRARTDQERSAIANLVGMSIPFIDGLLSTGRGLELANDFQRRSLELSLDLRNDREIKRAAPPTDREIQFLTAAAKEAGHRDDLLVHAVLLGVQQLRTTRARRGLLSSDRAREVIEAVRPMLVSRFPEGS